MAIARPVAIERGLHRRHRPREGRQATAHSTRIALSIRTSYSLAILDVTLRLGVSLAIPNALGAERLSKYVLMLSLVTWVQLTDLGNYTGHSLRIMDREEGLLTIGALSRSVLATLSINYLIAIPLFWRKLGVIGGEHILMLACVSAISLLSVASRSVAQSAIDFVARLASSVTTAVVAGALWLSAGSRLSVEWLITLPAVAGLLVFAVFRKRIGISTTLMTKFSLRALALRNIDLGWRLYLVNISLLSLLSLDRIVFSTVFQGERLAAIYVCSTISGCHILIQGQYSAIHQRTLLGAGHTLTQRLGIFWRSLAIQAALSSVVFLAFTTGVFARLFPAYSLQLGDLALTEVLGVLNSTVGLVFWIAEPRLASWRLVLATLVIPIAVYAAYEAGMLSRLVWWPLVHGMLMIVLAKRVWMRARTA